MSALIELVPPMRVEDSVWLQPLDSAVDVAEYTDAVVIVNVTSCEVNEATDHVRIHLLTALENYDERYVQLKELADIESNIMVQTAFQVTLTGPGETSSELISSQCPGFGRFLRVMVVAPYLGAAPVLAFDVKALLRAR